MGKAFFMLGLAGILAACLFTLPASEGSAGALADLRQAAEQQRLITPVLVWKDCQRIAMCTGCRPHYRCRSCEYKRTCQGGVCGWGDVCVWGPYVRVLPPGARIIQ